MRSAARSRRSAVTLLVLLMAAGCSTPGTAPVERGGGRQDTSVSEYTVRGGDTLYAIAWTFGLTWQELARINNIRAPFTIFPGQNLRVRADGAAKPPQSSKPRPPPAAPSRPPVANKPDPRPPVARPTPRPTPAPSRPAPRPPATEPSAWNWPAAGRVVSTFGPNNKGIDIQVADGQAVVAAAAGDVVYAGKGIRGLGLLVIVRHSAQLLSAYGHSGRILVKEGVRVKAGQRLAETGSREAQKTRLHFEIRRDGKPVDPRKLLPKR